MTTLYWFNQIETLDRSWVGDEAFHLSQLYRGGYPVVEGFVINNQIFQEFLASVAKTSSLLADFPSSSLYLDVDNPRSLQFVALQSRQAIMETPFQSLVWDDCWQASQTLASSTLMVRASPLSLMASQDMGGIFPAQICSNSPESLEWAIKKVWSSVFSAKSLLFCDRSGIKLEKIPFTVLVHPLNPAIASGTAYLAGDHLTLKATWGEDLSILKGEVDPDEYHLNLVHSCLNLRKLGHKRYGYRLSTAHHTTFLEGYVLSQTEQENFVLNDLFLQQFSELGQKLTSFSDEPLLFEWTIPDIDTTLSSSISIHRLHPAFVVHLTDLSIEIKDNKVIKGISASRGLANAPIYHLSNDYQAIPPQHILVADRISPQLLTWLRNAAGIVLEEGGMTSHAAILAREVGIPALVGVQAARQRLHSGDIMTIDGNKGQIYPFKGVKQELTDPAFIQKTIASPVIATQLRVNMSQPTFLTEIKRLPIDGIGLIRSELMLLDLFQEKSLDQWLTYHAEQLKAHLIELIGQFVVHFKDSPVFYRSLDLKKENSFPFSQGTSAYLVDSRFFEIELQALRYWQARGYHQIHLILPLVRGVEEFCFCQNWVKKVGLDQIETFQLWIMAEVPSAIFLLEDYIQAGLQGIAIGTNDLTQFLLGINRETSWESDPKISHHPALMKALEQIIKQAKKHQIPCSICGQLPVHSPDLIEKFIRWGIDAISVESASVEGVYQAIATAERKILLDFVRQNNPLDIEKL